MTTLTATFRIVTPMFLSGADQTKAELRAASIKGALRFWWRALQWGEFAAKQDPIGELQKAEAELFGSANGGQSKVLIRIAQGTHRQPIPKDKVLKQKGDGWLEPKRDQSGIVGEGARYLGYGVMVAFFRQKKDRQTNRPIPGTESFAGQLTRPCYPSPIEDFVVEFLCRNDSAAEQIQNAIIALGLFGGLGSKSRKGYGSLTLTSLTRKSDDSESPIPLPEHKSFINQIRRREGLSEWTAFSSRSQFVLLEGNAGESPLELLNRIGRDQVFYRRWGLNGKVFGTSSEAPRFKDDHDLMADVVNSNATASNHPARIGFGLPQNYFFSTTKSKGGVEPSEHDRRASPLFIHIHQSSPKTTPTAILTFLPAKFLPAGETISVGKDRGRKTEIACKPEDDLYEPIVDWMNSLVSGSRKDGVETKETFENAVFIPASIP